MDPLITPTDATLYSGRPHYFPRLVHGFKSQHPVSSLLYRDNSPHAFVGQSPVAEDIPPTRQEGLVGDLAGNWNRGKLFQPCARKSNPGGMPTVFPSFSMETTVANPVARSLQVAATSGFTTVIEAPVLMRALMLSGGRYSDPRALPSFISNDVALISIRKRGHLPEGPPD